MQVSDVRLNEINPLPLRRQLQEIKKLWQQDYSNNGETLIALIAEVLPPVKKKEEWQIYFELLTDLFYLLNTESQYRKLIKYAEMFYQDLELHLDRAIRQHPGSDLGVNCIYVLSQIHDVYVRLHQINDEKMEQFCRLYKRATDKYGKVSSYWSDQLDLALIYGDAAMADLAAEKCLQYPKTNGCYVCNQCNFLGYYLLRGRAQEAEDLIRRLIAKDIPKDKLWCYDRCQRADGVSLYEQLLIYAADQGRPAEFKRFLSEFLAISDGNHNEKDRYTAYPFLRAAVDDFSLLSFDMEVLKEDLEDTSMSKTYDEFRFLLMWYVYFEKLSRKGVKTVLLEVNTKEFPLANDEGETKVNLAKAFFLAQADDLGMKFEQSRSKFNYMSLKESYFSCGGLI